MKIIAAIIGKREKNIDNIEKINNNTKTITISMTLPLNQYGKQYNDIVKKKKGKGERPWPAAGMEESMAKCTSGLSGEPCWNALGMGGTDGEAMKREQPNHTFRSHIVVCSSCSRRKRTPDKSASTDQGDNFQTDGSSGMSA